MGRPAHQGIALVNYTIKRVIGKRIKNTACAFKLHITDLQSYQLIGDIDQARIRIEGLFSDGMTWENRKNNWQFDHIRPLSQAVDQNDFIERCHYSNIQPLWAIDNQRKGSTEQILIRV